MMFPYFILKPVPPNKNAKSHYLYDLIPRSKFLAVPGNLQHYTLPRQTGQEIIRVDLIRRGDAGKS